MLKTDENNGNEDKNDNDAGSAAALNTDEDGSKLRRFSDWKIPALIKLVAVGMSLYHIYALGIVVIDPFVFYCLHWGLGLFLVFFLYPAFPKRDLRRIPWYDIIAVAATVVITVYVISDYRGLMTRSVMARPSQTDLIFGTMAILLTIEAARRTMGNGLPIVVLFLIAYAAAGKILPTAIANKGFGPIRIISFLFSTEGIYGIAMKMSATNVFLLVLFGAFLGMSGAGDFFMRLATSIAGASRGGPAKVATLSSALFGSISGSAVANVVSTGTFTIPLMKRMGYRPAFAGAVEAVASTGGQIMPPVMGSGAFIMAEMLGIPYSNIAFAALIPALLYYYSVFISIDLEAARNNLAGIPTDEMEKPTTVLKEGWSLMFPILTLIYCLGVRQDSISRAGLISIAACYICSFAQKSGAMKPKDIIEALHQGAVRSLTIITAVGCAGLAIGLVMLTGLGMKLTLIMSNLAGSSLFLSLLFSALSATILGMGLPTVAAYIVCAAVMASGLRSLGIAPLAAHMFLFYFSILSMITPPVALAAYTAANLAGANPNDVGFAAVRLGLIAFLLPFFFIYGPALLMIGGAWEIALAVVSAFIGINAFTIALYGWYRGETLKLPVRFLLIAAGVCMIMPGIASDLVGGCIVGAFAVKNYETEMLR
ncbi:C4-dicarboxylate ABC transporter [Synergistales bacterium]|nr:C4-dicarboxylate ABC transporter [Synergistales bacterium]